MGQRLNIEIVNGETSLANCYYHWSAYTSSALSLTKTIIDAYYDSKLIVGLKMAVELLEATGAGVNTLERAGIEKCQKEFDGITFKDAASRNLGLISVTEEGKEVTRKWEEGRVTIDLGSETFCFDVVWDDPFDVYLEEYHDGNGSVTYEDLSECPYNLSSVPFIDIGDLIFFVDSHPEGCREGEEAVIHWIGG